MLRQIDSSLLEEWERMRDRNFQPRAETAEARPPGAEEAARDITRDAKAFTAAIRNRIFTFLRALVGGEFDVALEAVNEPGTADDEPWTPERLRHALEEYHAGHERIRLDPTARNAQHTYITRSDNKASWRVQQMLIDPAEDNDWVSEFEVDIAKSRAAGEPVMRLTRLGSLV